MNLRSVVPRPFGRWSPRSAILGLMGLNLPSILKSHRFSTFDVPAALQNIMARQSMGKWAVVPQGDRQ